MKSWQFAKPCAESGDLLIATREGLSRMHNGSFSKYALPDPLGRRIVFDALEDSRGQYLGGRAQRRTSNDGTRLPAGGGGRPFGD